MTNCFDMPGLEPVFCDLPDMKAVRRTLHQHPELGLEETWTAGFIADYLGTLGYQVHQGLAGTGIVGTLKNGRSTRTLGLRSDMDGLPVTEQSDLSYTSRHPGKMHACGHDGHMAMLLGAASALAKRRRFDGTVHLIFQPAEENTGGARMMVEEGLFRLFPCDAVFALHNSPQLPFGQFAFRNGPIMAAVDEAHITVHGRGGHGSSPENAADPIVAGAAVVMALQTIVSRNVSAFEPAVISVGSFHGGTASNIIPGEVRIVAGIRSFDEMTRRFLEKRIIEITELQARSFGMTASVDYRRSYDVTVNHDTATDFVRDLAVRYAGGDRVIDLVHPDTGSEDFTYMLQACPGSIFFVGTKASETTPPLHHPEYDFNDDLLPVGAGFWVTLAETWLAP